MLDGCFVLLDCFNLLLFFSSSFFKQFGQWTPCSFFPLFFPLFQKKINNNFRFIYFFIYLQKKWVWVWGFYFIIICLLFLKHSLSSNWIKDFKIQQKIKRQEKNSITQDLINSIAMIHFFFDCHSIFFFQKTIQNLWKDDNKHQKQQTTATIAFKILKFSIICNSWLLHWKEEERKSEYETISGAKTFMINLTYLFCLLFLKDKINKHGVFDVAVCEVWVWHRITDFSILNCF